MKRILAILILAFMVVWFIIPVLGSETNEKDELNQKTRTIINEDIKLNVGAAEILFEETTDTYYNGWTKERINLRNRPSLDSEVITTFEFNQPILYQEYDDKWLLASADIEGEFVVGYVYSKYVSNTEYEYEEYEFPKNSGFKSYMPYTTITNKSSNQYKLQENFGYTGEHGIRQINNRYCVAIGTAFNADIGTYFDLVLENDEVIPCIVGDIKADRHTKKDNITTISNGCVVEFLIDAEYLNKTAKKNGDISFCFNRWDSPALKIKVYDKNVLN